MTWFNKRSTTWHGSIEYMYNVHFCVDTAGKKNLIWRFFLKMRKSNDHKGPGQSWSWSYGNWIYNYLCNQCIPLKLRVRTSLIARCTRYNIKITFASDLRQIGGFLRVLRFSPPIKPRYNWNIVENDIKHHNPN